MAELPIPPHFDPARVGEVWRVDYAARFEDAAAWRDLHGLRPAAGDDFRVGLVAVDVQNTFCTPGFELVVEGAVEDSRRLCEFLYRNLDHVTQVFPTLDTHQALQIFHRAFLVDGEGRHPEPFTIVSAEDVAGGRWRASTAAEARGVDPGHLARYTRALAAGGKYALAVWPFHAMLGGIGHALVSAVEEAIFFHGGARESGPKLQQKGADPLTEHYSALGPEVETTTSRRNGALIEELAAFDAIVIAGQAKSHCVAWTVQDLLGDPLLQDPGKVYLLEDCTSPVVVPGADYTAEASAAFARFAESGAHVVRSTDPMSEWPGAVGQAIA